MGGDWIIGLDFPLAVLMNCLFPLHSLSLSCFVMVRHAGFSFAFHHDCKFPQASLAMRNCESIKIPFFINYPVLGMSLLAV